MKTVVNFGFQRESKKNKRKKKQRTKISSKPWNQRVALNGDYAEK